MARIIASSTPRRQSRLALGTMVLRHEPDIVHGANAMRGLKDKTAIVTGGATLMGFAVVRAFVDAGTRVAIADY
jgi:hypothetical protein